MLVDHLDVVLVDEGGTGRGKEYAHSHGNKHQTSLAGRVPLALLVDNREGNEEHVQETIQDTHVHGDEKDDELAEEELERADEEDEKTLREGAHVKLLLRDVVRLAGCLTELGGAAGEDGGSIGLGDGEGDEDPDNTGEDELDPVQPTPVRGVGEETTDKRANCSFLFSILANLRTGLSEDLLAGPMKGAAEKAAMGTPRSSFLQRSARVPPTRVMGAENAIPSMARQMSSVSMFLARAQGMMKMTAMSKVEPLDTS